MTNSTVRDNSAGDVGGGIHAIKANLTASTVSGNHSGTDGGGILADTATLTNSTVSGNHSGTDGGGIHLTQGADILNSTIVLNTAGNGGGGVSVLVGPVRVKNTIIAVNQAKNVGRDVSGWFVSQGHNLVEDPNSGNGSTNFGPGNGDVLRVNPKLAPLGDYGGPTRTHLPLPGSAAIDRGDGSGAPPADQRGVARPQGPFVDIGAVERAPGDPNPEQAGPRVIGTSVNYNPKTGFPISILVTFDKDVDPATFNAALVSAGGVVRHPSAAPTGISREFLIFVANVPPGDYTLKIGPGVTDLAGNPMADEYSALINLDSLGLDDLGPMGKPKPGL
jgi:predicted outer membrane repeat protein